MLSICKLRFMQFFFRWDIGKRYVNFVPFSAVCSQGVLHHAFLTIVWLTICVHRKNLEMFGIHRGKKFPIEQKFVILKRKACVSAEEFYEPCKKGICDYFPTLWGELFALWVFLGHCYPQFKIKSSYPLLVAFIDRFGQWKHIRYIRQQRIPENSHLEMIMLVECNLL